MSVPDPTSDKKLGYADGHGPTPTDLNYAIMYATSRIAKETCEQNSDHWQWIEEDCGYPCPFDDPSLCQCGYCALTKNGCDNYSHYPFFDCTRVNKTCIIDGVSKPCTVCDYSPKLDQGLKDKHIADGPTIASIDPTIEYYNEGGSVMNNCHAGDSVSVNEKHASENSLTCRPKPKTNPYYILSNIGCLPDKDGETLSGSCKPTKTNNLVGTCSSSSRNTPGWCNQIVPCKPDTDGSGSSMICALAGLGGLCSSEDTKVEGHCYENTPFYAEWIKDFQQWKDSPVRDTCVVAVPEYRRWCEMPWTRPGKTEVKEEQEKFGGNLNEIINNEWETKWKQPFYYDRDTSKCYVTRDYCHKDVISEGGFSMSYGKGKEFLVFSTCDTTDHFVESGKDCCTGIWQSLEQFFFGRTFSAELKSVLEGKISVLEFLKLSNSNYALVTFFSDRRLKTLHRIELKDFAAPGIHLWSFQWTPEATSLYGFDNTTIQVGVMADEVAKLYPDLVMENENGHLFVILDPLLAQKDPVYLSIAIALKSMKDHTMKDHSFSE